MRMSFRQGAISFLAGLLLAASGASAQTSYTPATPDPGTEIPRVDVKLGMRPYADNTFYVIGLEKGWFKDVGITITPEPYGLKTSEEQWISLLLNRQVDINSATCPAMLPSYRTNDQLKCAGFAVTFYGSVMLANPKLGLKTLADYVEEGLPFEEALAKALEPLSGQQVYVPAGIADKIFSELPFQLADTALPEYVTMEDPQMLLLAQSGRADFVHPNGAPIAQTLLNAGWTPIYDIGQLVKYGPGGVDSPLEPLVFNNGWAATADYIEENKTTMLRFASVVYRIFHELEKDPALYAVYTDYLNSVAGTSLTPEEVRQTVTTLDPFVTFEDQSRYFVEKESAEYYGNSMGALIKSLEATKSIPEGITPDDIVWAAPMYHELLDYKAKTDALMTEAEGATLDDADKALIADAKTQYERYNFLDAWRLASAAMAD